MSLEVIDLGLIDYAEALEKQLELVKQIQANPDKDFLILCSHPDVVTLGRSSTPDDYKDWQGSLIEVSRGGKATYHGPSQLVIYPIINLARDDRKSFKAKDLHSYLRTLENYIIEALKELSIEAESRTEETIVDGKKLSMTGVWVGDKKIASIGIAVQKWVSYHGISINVSNDPNAYKGINPCGFNREVMTSIEACDSKKTREAVTGLFSELAKTYFL